MLTVNTGQDDDGNELIDYKQDLSKMTKMVTLLGELRALKDEDKDSRAIIFTAARSDAAEGRRALLAALAGTVFEFNKQTARRAATASSKSSRMASAKTGLRRSASRRATTAAVGVTPHRRRAASSSWSRRADPATELQAAGRIHRLGQTKEVLIKRFAFRNTIEHAIVDLHEEIKAKRLKAGGAYVSDPIVQQVFKKLNLHLEVHTPDPQQTHEVIVGGGDLPEHAPTRR